MHAVIKVAVANGRNEFTVKHMDELQEVTADLDRAGTDYTLEFVKIS